MKKKLIVLVVVLALVVTASATVSFAAGEWSGPAGMLADLTGKDVEEIRAEWESGTLYGVQAEKAGVREAFQAEKLEIMKDRLEQAVEDGRITQEEADAKALQIEENIAACDGTGQRIGRNGTCAAGGLGWNSNDGQAEGQGFGQGQGFGRNKGQNAGAGFGRGRCTN